MYFPSSFINQFCSNWFGKKINHLVDFAQYSPINRNGRIRYITSIKKVRALSWAKVFLVAFLLSLFYTIPTCTMYTYSYVSYLIHTYNLRYIIGLFVASFEPYHLITLWFYHPHVEFIRPPITDLLYIAGRTITISVQTYRRSRFPD